MAQNPDIFLRLEAEIQEALAAGDYCKASDLRYQLALELAKDDATINAAITRLYEASAINPFNEDIIELIISLRDQQGRPPSVNLSIQLEDAKNTTSACEA